MKNFKRLEKSRRAYGYFSGGEEGKGYSVRLSYELGGYNYWHSETNSRGYYLHISEETRSIHTFSDGTKWISTQCVLGEGLKMLVGATQRFSEKDLKHYAEKYDELVPKIIKWVDYIEPSVEKKQDAYKYALGKVSQMVI